jgi:aspartate carbamoyltransferase catalytic subunit
MTAVAPFRHRHLLGIEPLSAEDIVQVLDLSETFFEINERPIKKVPTLRGRTVINLFLEPSTRTRTSFEIAAKRLSAEAINIAGSSSSTVKGETLVDTARNLNAMGADVIVVRHKASGAAALVAEHVDASVINAGDGAHEHPTQALLDAMTIRRYKASALPKGAPANRTFAGLEVAICGDIEHSRVARSNLWSLTRLGARVRLCAPRTMMPRGVERILGDLSSAVRVTHGLDEALEGADVVMMLRIQSERLGQGPLFPTTREYSKTFGLSRRCLERAKPDAIVMHPGPMNRGVEIEPDVADGARAVILDQVTHGVAVRMSMLYLLGVGTMDEDAPPPV